MPKVREEDEDFFPDKKKKKRFIAHLVDNAHLRAGGRKKDSRYFRRRIASKKIAVVNFLIAQIERLVIVASLARPALKPGLIDRFAVLAESHGVKPVVVLTKRDLVKKQESDHFLHIYKTTGYPCYVYSSLFPQGHIHEEMVSAGRLREEVFKKKATAVVGHSGVGKTTLLLAVDSGYRAKTAPISNFTKKGRHTTTRVKLHEFTFGGVVYDMPGLKEIDYVNIEKERLQRYFPDIDTLAKKCRFKNCQHIEELNCNVKESVARKQLAEQRYTSYLNIYESLQ